MNQKDKIEASKYVQIIIPFTSKIISTSEFERIFLEKRRNDSYWMSGSLNKDIGQILDRLFLDVSDYVSPDLYDPDDPFDINEQELYKRVCEAKIELERILANGALS